MILKENQQLAEYTRIGLGGSADLFVIAETDAEVAEAEKLAQEQGVAYTYLPSTDVLISSTGIRGVVCMEKSLVDTLTQDNKIAYFGDVRIDEAVRSELERTHFPLAEISKKTSIPACVFIQEMGLADHEMGHVRVADDGETIARQDHAQPEDIIMLASYVKQQIRDTYGVQLRERYDLFGF